MRGSSIVIVGFGTPTSTTVPARSRASNACRYVSGRPTASITTSGPNPPVSARSRSTTSSLPASTVSVAPKPRAHSSLRLSTSTAMTWRAPAYRAPAIAALPTPPQPMTATVSPLPTGAVLTAAPNPAITPQPISPAAAGSDSGTFVHWPACTSVFSANAPMPSAGDSGVPSASVIGCDALKVLKQYQGRPRRQARQLPHTARQFSTTKSPTPTSVTPAPTDSTRPAASCPSRNG